MKKIVTIIHILFILLNTLSGLIISSYNYINWLSADVYILITYFLNIILINSNSSDGMKIGVSYANVLIFLITIFFIIKMPLKIEDNYYLVTIFFLLAIQFFLVFSSKFFKKISGN